MKKIILCISILFLTGCSLKYHIDFVDDKFIENISFSDVDEVEYDLVKNGKFAPIPAFNDSLYSVEDPVKVDGIEYYNISAKDKRINFNYEYNLNNFERAYSVGNCYDYFKIFQDNDEIIISTDKKFKCFFPGRNLENVDIVLTTNHTVTYNNADEVNDNEYIWHITKDNKDDANIQISFSKDYKNKFLGKDFFEVLVYAGFGIGIIFIFLFFILIKNKRVNKI